MPIYEIQSPDGRTFELEGDSAPNEQELEQVFQSLPALPDELPEKENKFTLPEKIFAGALPIIGGIGGGVAAAIPGALTGPGLLAAVAAGGAAGAAVGRGAADIFEAYAGGKNRSAKEIGSRALKEGVLDVGFTLGTAGIGKLAKPLLRPLGKKITTGLIKAASPVRKAEKFRRIIKRVDSLNKGLDNKLKLSRLFLEKKQVAKALSTEGKIKALDSRIGNTVVKTAPILEEGLDKSFKAVSEGYNTLKVGGIGNQPLELTGIKEALDNIVKSGGLEAFDSSSIAKISKVSSIIDSSVSIPADIAKSINDLPIAAQKQALEQLGISAKKKALNVSDGITIRREMADILRGLRRGSPTAKNVIAPEFEKILKAVDIPLDELTGGQLSILNERWRELASIEDITKSTFGLFRTELLKPTTAQLAKRGRRVTSALEKISAKDLDSTQGVLKPASDKIGNLIEQARALKLSGVPTLTESGDAALKQIHSIAFNRKSIDALAKPLKTLKLENRFRIIKNEIINNNKYKNSLADKALNFEETIGTSRGLMSLFIAGRSVDSLPGLPRLIKNSVRGLLNIFSFSKWSPTAAATVLDEIRNFSPKLAKAKLSPLTRRILNRLFSDMSFIISEESQ